MNRSKLWLTLGLLLFMGLGAWGESRLLAALPPNPFLVGLLGLALGAALAVLISLWWPKRR